MLSDKISFVKKDRRGACNYLFADIGIDENGDVLGCAWFDYSKLVKLGNIKTNTPEEVVAKHKEIVRQQEFGVFIGPCKNCTVYACTGKRMDGRAE
jgi:radical SAM protein with 4Fe4S-binding SPASM domain